MELLKQSVDRRRDLVRRYHYIGLSIFQILERLDGHKYPLFPVTADYDEKYGVIASDVAIIKKKDLESINVTEFDAQEQHALYIARQTFLYNLSLEDGNLALASSLSKDIARGYGISTDEAIVLKGDLMSMLRNAQQTATRKLEERKIIDVTPQEAIPDALATKVQADAIFHKR